LPKNFKKKKATWLFSGFSEKTPTAAIWRFVRSFKKKFLPTGCPVLDQVSLATQNSVLEKLCSFSCLHY